MASHTASSLAYGGVETCEIEDTVNESLTLGGFHRILHVILSYSRVATSSGTSTLLVVAQSADLTTIVTLLAVLTASQPSSQGNLSGHL